MKQRSLPQQDDCKTKKDTTYCITIQGDKGQESMQSNITPDPRHHMGK